MKVTSFEVAKLAGVSQSTVSRAMRGDRSIGAATVKRVLAAAAELNYTPSERARDLSTRSTRRIAMLVDLDNPLWALLVSRLHDILAERDYRLTLIAGHGDQDAIEANLMGGGIDGVIVSTLTLTSSLPKLLRERGVPAVLLHRYTDDTELDSCVADNYAGGAAAAKMLLDAGHRKIGALFGPSDISTARDREAGFRGALADAGVTLPARWVRRGGYHAAHAREAVPALVGGASRPTALFCWNDVIAISALNAAYDLGLSVPDDLAVTGFDDIDEAAWPVFGLSTVAVPFGDMMHSAVNALMERIGGYAGAGRRTTHAIAAVPRRTHGVSG